MTSEGLLIEQWGAFNANAKWHVCHLGSFFKIETFKSLCLKVCEVWIINLIGSLIGSIFHKFSYCCCWCGLPVHIKMNLELNLQLMRYLTVPEDFFALFLRIISAFENEISFLYYSVSYLLTIASGLFTLRLHRSTFLSQTIMNLDI